MAPKRQRTGQEGASSSNPRNTGGEVNFGSRNSHMKTRYEKLKLRQVVSTKFACRPTLMKYNMFDGVSTLLRKAGLIGVLNKGASTWQRPTYEFLASVAKATKDDEPAVSFRLMNRAYVMSYSEVATAFGWVVGGDDWNLINDGAASNFWLALTGIAYNGKGGNKVNSIIHPCFRYAYKLLNDSVFLQGEVGAVSLFGVKTFWALSPEGTGIPPWVDIFVTGCIQEQERERGKISFGGMVTLLADALGVQFTPDCIEHTSGHLYDQSFLKSAHFIDIDAAARHRPRYLIRGHPPIPLPPHPANLFDIVEGMSTNQLRVRVLQGLVEEAGDEENVAEEEEQNAGQEQREEEDEVRNEGGGGERDVGASEPWRAYIDERIQGLHNALQERWALEDRRWAAQEERLDRFFHQFQGFSVQDPAEVAAREARRQEAFEKQSRDHPGTGPGSSDP